MAVNFSQLLQVDASKIEKPKPLPVGTYDCQVVKHEFGESASNKTPYCRVWLQPIVAGADVDQDALSALGDHPFKRQMKIDFWLTSDSLYRFSEFFRDTLGLDVTGKTLDELCPQMNGQTVKAEIIHVPSKDGTEIYANINRLIAA